jgi:hypothetical protein
MTWNDMKKKIEALVPDSQLWLDMFVANGCYQMREMPVGDGRSLVTGCQQQMCILSFEVGPSIVLSGSSAEEWAGQSHFCLARQTHHCELT